MKDILAYSNLDGQKVTLLKLEENCSTISCLLNSMEHFVQDIRNRCGSGQDERGSLGMVLLAVQHLERVIDEIWPDSDLVSELSDLRRHS